MKNIPEQTDGSRKQDDRILDEISLEGELADASRHSSIQGGEKLLGVLLLLFGAILALPVLLAYFIKSPLPDQAVTIFGISYHGLVFAFFLSAALIIVSSLFFIRVKMPVMFALFFVALLSCVPFILGLANDYTLGQAILEVPDLAWLPFFLRPANIFIQLLLPAGILAFLFLQIRNVFSRKPHGYSFLGSVVYLVVAAYIGFSTLIQTGEPNMVSILARPHDNGQPSDQQPVAEPVPWQQEVVSPESARQGEEPDAAAGRFRQMQEMRQQVPPDDRQAAMPTVVPPPDVETGGGGLERAPAAAGQAADPAAPVLQADRLDYLALQGRMVGLEQHLAGLDQKMEQAITLIEQLQNQILALHQPVAGPQAAGQPKGHDDPSPEAGAVGADSQAVTAPEKGQGGDAATLAGLARKIELLSEKIDRIAASRPQEGSPTPVEQ